MYVFDRRWHTKNVKDGTATAAPHSKEVIVDEFIVEAIHTIPTISVFIIKHAKNRRISKLRLCAHGNSGYLELGTGLDIASQADFTKLHSKKVFTKDAAVEIYGCAVASATWVKQDKDGNWLHGTWKVDGIGHKFVKALAATLRVKVRAAVDLQHGDRLYRYENQYITVEPSGHTTVSGKAATTAHW
jgi:hypothetical protein